MEEPQNKSTSNKFFLTRLSSLDVNPNSCSFGVTNYNLSDPKVNAVIEAASPRRAITIDDCVLQLGRGEGTTQIGGVDCNVSYAWRGLTEKDLGIGQRSSDRVVSWKVSFTPKDSTVDFMKKMDEFIDSIYFEEGGKEVYSIPKQNWLNAMTMTRNVDASLEDYRAQLERFAEAWRTKDKKERIGYSADHIAKLDAHYSPEGIAKEIERVRNAETLEFTPFLFMPKEIEPWTALNVKN
ncbi:hypothetical protein HY837_06240 [archaeon]|nr:hypothetical protein [archaeon]